MSSVVHCVCCRSRAHVAVKMYHRDRMNSMNVKQARRGSPGGGKPKRQKQEAAGWRGSECRAVPPCPLFQDTD